MLKGKGLISENSISRAAKKLTVTLNQSDEVVDKLKIMSKYSKLRLKLENGMYDKIVGSMSKCIMRL